MPNEGLPNKREVMLALLAETSVFVHLDPRGPTVRVPPWFKNQPQLVLQIGLNMAVPIVDLDVGDQGISCTLSFSRRPFFCSIPWSAVYGLVGDNGPGLIWPDDVPSEVAAQVKAQTQAQIPKPQPQKQSPNKGGGSREAPRARLRAVGSTAATQASPSEDSVADTSAPAPAAAAKIPSVPAPQALPAADSEQLTGDGIRGGKSPEVTKPQPSLKPVQSNRPGSKRELPPYLRVVK